MFEHAGDFDLIHNGFDFLPLTYSGLVDTPVVTTIHGFSSPRILPVYQRYDATTTYVAISDADRHPSLHYAATIHHGIDTDAFAVDPEPGEHLLFFGRIHPDKGTAAAIEVAARAGRRLVIAGIVQDEDYFRAEVEPHLDGDRVRYVGPVDAAERSAVLGHAYALLHLIDFDEPFGYSVVEAMAAGTPVIAFRRGSMAELVRRRHHRLPGRHRRGGHLRGRSCGNRSIGTSSVRRPSPGSAAARWSTSTSGSTAPCSPGGRQSDRGDRDVTDAAQVSIVSSPVSCVISNSRWTTSLGWRSTSFPPRSRMRWCAEMSTLRPDESRKPIPARSIRRVSTLASLRASVISDSSRPDVAASSSPATAKV